jgi:2'-5' RNA ligase
VIRAFAAIGLPEAVRFDLMLLQQGLGLPRPVPPENLHMTLVFLGELPEPVLADVDLAFGAVRAPGFPLAVKGVGMFGGARPRVVYAGVAAEPALMHLQAKLETAARQAGVEVEARRYVPHVTLARLPERLEGRARIEHAVALRGLHAPPAFQVEDFTLYRSHLTGRGPVYEELAAYPLGSAA